MPLYSYSGSALNPLPRTTFAAEQIRERNDIQRLLLERIDILGEDLLAVAEEYSLFNDSRRRVDILALDRQGSLVVIELKRTDDGGHMELQALRYAAMVSTMTLDHLVETYASAHEVEPAVARHVILDWIEEPFDELANGVRIILVSADFSTEITSTVLWLNGNYGTDISCFRIVAYKLVDQVLVDLQQIIPLPEAKDFQIQQRRKETSVTTNRESSRDYTQYDITVGADVLLGSSKQNAVKTAIQWTYRAGVDLNQIQDATARGRWVRVSPAPDETVIEAFHREKPHVSTDHRWFDLGISDESGVWVVPKLGGTKTEEMLDALRNAASPTVPFTWRRSTETADESA